MCAGFSQTGTGRRDAKQFTFLHLWRPPPAAPPATEARAGKQSAQRMAVS